MKDEGWIEHENIEDRRSDYPALYEELGRLMPSLTAHQEDAIVALVIQTCPHCWAASRGCYCHRDD